MPSEAFKVCGSCGYRWADWQGLVEDRRLRLLGLQVVPGLPEANVLVFEHVCGTSVSVLTSRLRHLVPGQDGAADRPLLFGTEECSGHCRFLENLSRCDQPCSNARDRRLAILVAAWRATRQGEGTRARGQGSDHHDSLRDSCDGPITEP